MNARLLLPAFFLLAGQVVAQSNPFAESAAKREAARLRDADRATIATQRAQQEIEKIGAIDVPRPVLEPGVVNIDAPVMASSLNCRTTQLRSEEMPITSSGTVCLVSGMC